MLPGPKGKGKFKVFVIITEKPGVATVCQWRQALPLAGADYRDNPSACLRELCPPHRLTLRTAPLFFQCHNLKTDRRTSRVGMAFNLSEVY